MNKRGQTLILFVLLIPILLILAALVIDIGLVTNAKLKLDNLTTSILEEFYDQKNEENIEQKIKEIYQKNNIKIDHLEINSTDTMLNIKIEDQIDSIFGRIIGIKEYSYQTDKTIKEEKKKE